MKININKSIKLLAAFAVVIGLSSCLKEKGFVNETDFSGLQDHVTIDKGGLTNFSAASVGFNSGDTTKINLIVNLASVDLPKSSVPVTIGIDAAKIATYNAANGTNYVLPPASAYTLASNKVTIPAGQQYAQTTISFFKGVLDPATSYLIPVSIMDASGKALTSNFNTIYYHIIGNPLAGNYTQDFYRWNGTADTTTAPNSTVTTNVPIVISPVSGNSLLLPESYIQTFVGKSNGVILSFNISGSGSTTSFSSFAVSLDNATTTGLTAGGFKVISAPILVESNIVGNLSTHFAGSTFRIFTVLQNSSPALRTLIDQFTKVY